MSNTLNLQEADELRVAGARTFVQMLLADELFTSGEQRVSPTARSWSGRVWHDLGYRQALVDVLETVVTICDARGISASADVDHAYRDAPAVLVGVRWCTVHRDIINDPECGPDRTVTVTGHDGRLYEFIACDQYADEGECNVVPLFYRSEGTPSDGGES